MSAPWLSRADLQSAAIKLWTELPEARALIAEAVENPPAAHTFRYAFSETETRYIGEIPRQLRRIRDDFLDEVLKGPDEAAKALNFKLTVTEAIDRARAEAGVGEIEESFRIQREAAE